MVDMAEYNELRLFTVKVECTSRKSAGFNNASFNALLLLLALSATKDHLPYLTCSYLHYIHTDIRLPIVPKSSY